MSSYAPGTPEFIHRIEGLCLTPGNKTAGFDAFISTEVLAWLTTTAVDDSWRANLQSAVQERISAAGLLPAEQVSRCGVGFVDNTFCPRFFVTDPALGGSIGADPSDLERLTREGALAWIGPVVAYTPHNVDTPSQALALLVMVETWSELARLLILSHSA